MHMICHVTALQGQCVKLLCSFHAYYILFLTFSFFGLVVVDFWDFFLLCLNVWLRSSARSELVLAIPYV